MYIQRRTIYEALCSFKANRLWKRSNFAVYRTRKTGTVTLLVEYCSKQITQIFQIFAMTYTVCIYCDYSLKRWIINQNQKISILYECVVTIILTPVRFLPKSSSKT